MVWYRALMTLLILNLIMLGLLFLALSAKAGEINPSGVLCGGDSLLSPQPLKNRCDEPAPYKDGPPGNLDENDRDQIPNYTTVQNDLLQWFQMECVLLEPSKDRDPVYKIVVLSGWDAKMNLVAFDAVHYTRDGNIYHRAEQYEMTDMGAKVVNNAVRMFWTGHRRTKPSLQMIGLYADHIYDEWLMEPGKKRQLVTHSQCHKDKEKE